MVIKLQHPTGHQVLAGTLEAWLPLPPLHFFRIRLYLAGGLLSTGTKSEQLYDSASFPNPNLMHQSHTGEHSFGKKKSKVLEEKYYPNDLGEPKKSEYFTKSQLF